jgi:TatD DNase family protein
VHCFTGSEEKLSELVRRGFMIGLTGFICMQERGAHLRAAIQRGVIDLNKGCVCV